MSTLAERQQALLRVLFDWPHQDAANEIAEFLCQTSARGLKVYQANGHAMACSALRAAHPVVAQLLGDEGFDALACALWHAHPPQRGDVAHWGEALPAFVRGSRQLQDEPYLADVAAVEWALHRATTAADVQPDAASFGLLAGHDPQDLHLCLAPGATCLESPWPVVSIVNAHLHGQPTLAQAGELLRAGVGEDALVWRQGWQARVRQAVPGEAQLMAALTTGQTLGQALVLAPAIDIGAWLPLAVQTGLLLGVQLASEFAPLPDPAPVSDLSSG